jgi:hypothetical protein
MPEWEADRETVPSNPQAIKLWWHTQTTFNCSVPHERESFLVRQFYWDLTEGLARV